MDNRCKVIRFKTPRRYVLNGLWFGGDKPKRAIVFIHGLTSSAFSNHALIVPVADQNTAVIVFNNRGHGKISKINKIDKRKKKGYKTEQIGEAHEVFTDCVDDIQGIVDFLKNEGIDEIYLVGHSTGCQKSVYYLAQRNKQKLIKGVILMCPMSDYAGALKYDGVEELKKVEVVARKMVKDGKPHELIPLSVWKYQHDAQRFLSLYTPDSEEEVFSYVQPDKKPVNLRKIRIPTLIIFAGNDEYRERPIKQLLKWFQKNVKSINNKMVVIENAPHNFNGYETMVVNNVTQWLKKHN